MNPFLIALIVFVILTALVLVVGIVGMGSGGAFNRRYGNLLMRLRVLSQLGAVICFILYMLSLRGG
jgi:hypothetical protein